LRNLKNVYVKRRGEIRKYVGGREVLFRIIWPTLVEVEARERGKP
jgi:hypothetical protein